jgi:mannose-6-phosphate isomerase-like protein (cupin superfamily)
MAEPIDVADKLAQFSEHWSPKVIARLNDYEIKLAKLKGEFVWHTHDDTDELFLVLEGRLTIQLRDGCHADRAGRCGEHRLCGRRAHRDVRRLPARLTARPPLG